MVIKMVRIVVRMVNMVHMIILMVLILIRMGNKHGILQFFNYISDLLTWINSVSELLQRLCWILKRLYWMLQRLYWMLQRLCWNVTEAMTSSILFLEMLSHLKRTPVSAYGLLSCPSIKQKLYVNPCWTPCKYKGPALLASKYLGWFFFIKK